MCAIFTGNNLIELDEVESTNSFLTQLSSEIKLADGTAVIAKHQSAGKGQRGNVWVAQKDQNLTFSIIYFPPNANINKQFLLTQAISLGVYDYLISKCKNVSIKWPNDLHIENKKIGGMLIENSIKAELLSHSIIGIGLNINQENFEGHNNIATSLKLQNNITYNIKDELLILFSCIERRYLQWLNNNFNQLKEQYLNAMYLYKNWHQFTMPNGEKLNGKIIGIEEGGHLIIHDEHDYFHRFDNKEIIF